MGGQIWHQYYTVFETCQYGQYKNVWHHLTSVASGYGCLPQGAQDPLNSVSEWVNPFVKLKMMCTRLNSVLDYIKSNSETMVSFWVATQLVSGYSSEISMFGFWLFKNCDWQLINLFSVIGFPSLLLYEILIQSLLLSSACIVSKWFYLGLMMLTDHISTNRSY